MPFNSEDIVVFRTRIQHQLYKNSDDGLLAIYLEKGQIDSFIIVVDGFEIFRTRLTGSLREAESMYLLVRNDLTPFRNVDSSFRFTKDFLKAYYKHRHKKKSSLLHFAVEQQISKAIRVFIDNSMEENSEGLTPLMLAAKLSLKPILMEIVFHMSNESLVETVIRICLHKRWLPLLKFVLSDSECFDAFRPFLHYGIRTSIEANNYETLKALMNPSYKLRLNYKDQLKVASSHLQLQSSSHTIARICQCKSLAKLNVTSVNKSNSNNEKSFVKKLGLKHKSNKSYFNKKLVKEKILTSKNDEIMHFEMKEISKISSGESVKCSVQRANSLDSTFSSAAKIKEEVNEEVGSNISSSSSDRETEDENDDNFIKEVMKPPSFLAHTSTTFSILENDKGEKIAFEAKLGLEKYGCCDLCHPNRQFNVFHLAAKVGNIEILRLLFDVSRNNEFDRDLMNEEICSFKPIDILSIYKPTNELLRLFLDNGVLPTFKTVLNIFLQNNIDMLVLMIDYFPVGDNQTLYRRCLYEASLDCRDSFLLVLKQCGIDLEQSETPKKLNDNVDNDLNKSSTHNSCSLKSDVTAKESTNNSLEENLLKTEEAKNFDLKPHLSSTEINKVDNLQPQSEINNSVNKQIDSENSNDSIRKNDEDNDNLDKISNIIPDDLIFEDFEEKLELKSPLIHKHCRNDHSELVKLLIIFGANIYSLWKGLTPFETAVSYKSQKCITLLREIGGHVKYSQRSLYYLLTNKISNDLLHKNSNQICKSLPALLIDTKSSRSSSSASSLTSNFEKSSNNNCDDIHPTESSPPTTAASITKSSLNSNFNLEFNSTSYESESVLIYCQTASISDQIKDLTLPIGYINRLSELKIDRLMDLLLIESSEFRNRIYSVASITDQQHIGIMEHSIQVLLDFLYQQLHISNNQTYSTKSNISTNKRPLNILCLDGGGVRGLVLIEVLAEIEARLKIPSQNFFDFITGTSTGAILAFAFFTGPLTSIDDSRAIYFKFATEIFKGKRLYDLNNLNKILKQLFGNRTLRNQNYEKDENEKNELNDIQNVNIQNNSCDVNGNYEEKKNVAFFKSLSSFYATEFEEKIKSHRLHRIPRIACIAADFSVTVPETYLFRNYEPKETKFTKPFYGTSNAMISEALCASSAAPTFFNTYENSFDGKLRKFVDGGVLHNNPTLVGLAETAGEPTSMVLSIGTGMVHSKKIDICFDAIKNADFASVTRFLYKQYQNATDLLKLIVNTVSGSDIDVPIAEKQASLERNAQYFRVQPPLEDCYVEINETDDKKLLRLCQHVRKWIFTKSKMFDDICSSLLQNQLKDSKPNS